MLPDKSRAYFNEIDKQKAQWIRELIKVGVVAEGEVDERSIAEVQPQDLAGFTQCHFFAGIAVWSYALRLAGWPDDRPVWTGSCPCPSFSAAGKGQGFTDPRHLWPDWARLIRECRPARIFGEQVESAIGHGWLDLVQTELEDADYAVGKAVLGACSVGAPHRRQRLYFVAHNNDGRCKFQSTTRIHANRECGNDPTGRSEPFRLAYSKHDGRRTNEQRRGSERRTAAGRDGASGELADTERGRRKQRDEGFRELQQSGQGSDMGDSTQGRLGMHGSAPGESGHAALADSASNFWSDAQWIYCRDGKYRPTGAGVFPLAHGTSHRVAKLRGLGDAIVPQVAAEFIQAFLETQEE